MLQNERFGTGLKQYIPYATILDQSKTSDQYFRLFDVPEKLYVGKNSFRIRINKDTLVKGALVYIDIVNSNGDIIFHEIADIIGEDGSRLIVVHIYEDTPPGEATIYIGSRASRDVKRNIPLPYSNDPSSTDYIDFPNIIWAGKVVVIPTNENENEIIFAKAPLIKIKERFETYKSYASTENRKMSVSGSFNVSITPTTTAYEYSDSSKSGNKVAENSVEVILDPSIDNNEATSRQKSIPQYAELTSLYDAGGNFTEDFKGGEIIIRNLTSQLNVAGVTVPDFSCSIVEVVDDFTVKVSPEFRFLYGEKNENVFRAIKNVTNVTASYYTTKTELQTFDSESFIQLNFENLEPIAGKVDSVALSYKPYGSFGEFKPIGQFKVLPQEFLVDTDNLVISKTELIERPIGKPSGSSEFSMYWDVIDGKYPAGAYTSGSFSNQGIYFKTDTTPISDKSYDYKLKVKTGYGINAVPNTEFKVSFAINLEEKRTTTEDFQLDVFISGSSLLRDTINDRNVIDLITDGSEGTRISSVTKQTTGAVNTYTYYFKTISGGTIYPVFVIKNALVFSMKNISIQPRNEFGYSPNQAKLFVPLETLKKNTELVLNIDYLTKKSERAKISSQVYGLFFSGSGLTPAVVDDGLGGSIIFQDVSQSIASASVQTSGSTLYSFNPLTQNFSTNNSIFLGSDAGKNATDANYAIFLGGKAGADADQTEGSVFLGYQAGISASNAANSLFIGQYAGRAAKNAPSTNFIGSSAGDSASNAAYSNFLGLNSGFEATNASHSIFVGLSSGYQAINAGYSILIGKNAGATTVKSRSIKQHNIVIGNGISLPVASEYGLNIAGLIFGTGSYSSTTISAFSGSANGKVGINQPNPKYSLDVSGSGNYTNNLYVTGGLLVTQSYISTVDYIDFTTIPDPPVFNTGRLHWTDDTKTLQLDTDIAGFELEIGHQSIIRGRNTNSFTLTKGTVVYINGESGNRPTFASASWEDDPSSATTIGIIAQNITSNQTGYSVTNGLIRGINTNAFAPGTSLYLSSSGQYTDIPPFSPLHEVRLGKTITQATNGIIYIDIQNGYELGELHDVLITSASNGDLISWNSGSRVFQNTKILSGSYGVSGSLNVSQGITGSLFGTASYQSIKTNGTTLYSFHPLASTNIATTHGIFFGEASGNGATGANYGIFLGYATGENATNANSSIFVGSGAGLGATNASSSIVIGRNAGRYVVNANDCIFIGHAVGTVDATSRSPRHNNIVIGNGITVSGSVSNQVNIAGLIFGSGSIYNPSGAPNSGSANGKVGINQPNPEYPFDVSGSANFSNDVLITGSLKVSGSNTFTNIGPAIFSGSATVYSSSFSARESSVNLGYNLVTRDYTVTEYDYTINCNATGTITITLPTAVGITGRIYVIKNSSANTVEIDANSTETIDGSSANYNLSTQWQSITIQSTGANWIIIGKV